VDGHRLVRIPLIDYIRGSRTRNFGVGVMVYDSRNIFSYEQVNVGFEIKYIYFNKYKKITSCLISITR